MYSDTSVSYERYQPGMYQRPSPGNLGQGHPSYLALEAGKATMDPATTWTRETAMALKEVRAFSFPKKRRINSY